MLEFDKLIDWIYAPEDEFREKCAGAVDAREKLLQIVNSGEMNYKEIQEILDYDRNLCDHNIEQLSAKLLFDLTRNTGFEISKGVWESVGDRTAVSGQTGRRMISVD